MELIGVLADFRNISGCLLSDENFEVYHKRNATEEVMIIELKKLPVSRFCLVYLQGHGSPRSYIPNGFRITNNEISGLTSEVIYSTLFASDTYRRLLLVSDFCYSGDYYQLRYYLCLDGEPKWKESPHWNGQTSASPAFHFAGANFDELVYEGNATGGFFTKAFADTWNESLTLPEKLRKIRDLVSTQRARDAQKMPQDATQTPQIFCSFKPDLDDPEVLKKFQLGDLPGLE
ncbi:hypothetical protein FRC08_007131 [Ceratobasidium sp. 394]|nr:hypothetical protein FRC08_007131 [Ceratobasidium sp. 394]